MSNEKLKMFARCNLYLHEIWRGKKIYSLSDQSREWLSQVAGISQQTAVAPEEVKIHEDGQLDGQNSGRIRKGLENEQRKKSRLQGNGSPDGKLNPTHSKSLKGLMQASCQGECGHFIYLSSLILEKNYDQFRWESSGSPDYSGINSITGVGMFSVKTNRFFQPVSFLN